ncbi:hypothetical protein [Paraburkholderia kururiensis]|uniref:Uncharacterized protein n=1 Tax=Paraburkholderia kururiensis TaxID=984307 RepID=A0ABZ0WQQ9_9BURK|nr:hypothetical protein [Paraburkholderia kururiensis]WQD79693.1 hypothetical protein U0042_08435 [Paraburkholderia kururiensis]
MSYGMSVARYENAGAVYPEPERRGTQHATPPRTQERTQTSRADVCAEADALLALAREAGMLVTLDGQIGREKYQSVAGSVASLQRFAAALRDMFGEQAAA